MVSKTQKSRELLTVPMWTNRMKKRISDLSVKEVRALINSKLIPTEKDKKKMVCIPFISETEGIKMINAARKKFKSNLSKPVTKPVKEIHTNSPLPKNMLIEGQMVWVGKGFCPAVDMGAITLTRYIREGIFKTANIRLEKVGNGTERLKYKIEWLGLEKALMIKKICYSHKSLEEKQALMKDLLEPDENELEKEPDEDEEIEASIDASNEQKAEVPEAALSKPVFSSTEKIKEAFLELMVALAEPIVVRMKKKGILK